MLIQLSKPSVSSAEIKSVEKVILSGYLGMGPKTKEFENNKKYRFIKCDINNKKIDEILKKYKPVGIFNLAAETHVDRSIDSPKSFIESNILGVFNILEIFRKFSKKNTKTRLIHISTDEVFGDIFTTEIQWVTSAKSLSITIGSAPAAY